MLAAFHESQVVNAHQNENVFYAIRGSNVLVILISVCLFMPHKVGDIYSYPFPYFHPSVYVGNSLLYCLGFVLHNMKMIIKINSVISLLELWDLEYFFLL